MNVKVLGFNQMFWIIMISVKQKKYLIKIATLFFENVSRTFFNHCVAYSIVHESCCFELLL